LDVITLTHAHQDHLGGLTAVLENFRVGKLWVGREVNIPALSRLETLACQRGVVVEHEVRGSTFSLDGVEGEFLWPQVSANQIATSAKNNDSLVLRLRHGKRTLLLPGDAEKQSEREILAENNEETMQADVLKIGHHGSKNSTMPEFLAEVQPSIAIISSGEDNPYGHPSPELIERLKDANVRILRTDRNGAVHIVTDGKNLEVSCFVPCPQQATSEALVHRRAYTPEKHQNH
jgi:competence protein ComEC